ncbi:MAG: hypothetical protein ABI210_14290 [Abditibacteriaceae bacterium]
MRNAHSDETKSTFTATQQIDQLDEQVSEARILLQTGKASTALSQLSAAATDSWKVLFSVSDKNNFLTSTDLIPTSGIISRVAREAANVHYWWGMAAQQLNSPDEAITAFARAARFCPGNNDPLDLLSVNIQSALQQSLQNGFPQSAAPDVLADIATFVHHNQWQMKSNLYDVANPLDYSKSTFFIYIDGNIIAPATDLKVAPLYRNIPLAQLPPKLNSTQILYVYSIPASSYYSGLATLQLKVRFSDSNDATLAAKLAQLMLQAKLIDDNFLQRQPAMLTLWLESVNADWPNSVNVNSGWEAAAKIDSEPNSIMVFRMHEPRTDTEWMRELMHEYGHVAWPDFKTFAPPIEPNANGVLSETMEPIWFAQNREDDEDNRKLVYPLIEQTALPVLQDWLKEGADSPMATGTDEPARQYLQGLCVYIDRMYGTKVLSDVMAKLKNHNNTAKDVLDVLPEILAQDEIKSIYLPAAAINSPIDLTSLVNKSSVNFTTNTDMEFRVYIPSGTTEIDITWIGDGTISNKSTFGTGTANKQKLALDVKGISGWQKLSLQIDGSVTWGNAELITPSPLSGRGLG